MSGVYDDRPETALVPLHSADVEALLLTDGAVVAGNARRVRHLLSRMRATFAAHAALVRSLQRDLEQIAEAGKRRTNPVTAALDALSALTVEEQRLVFDRRATALVDAVQEAQRQADAARVEAASETNRARLVLGSLLAGGALDPVAAERVTQALAQLPLVRRPVPHAVPVPGGGFSVPARDAAGDDLSSELFG